MTPGLHMLRQRLPTFCTPLDCATSLATKGWQRSPSTLVVSEKSYLSRGPKLFTIHIDVPDSQLQTTNGVDMDLLMEGYKLAVARNNGTLSSHDENVRQPVFLTKVQAKTWRLRPREPSKKGLQLFCLRHLIRA